FPRSDPPQTSRYLRFAFGGIAYQFNALPFGLALAPRVFTKCSFRGCSRAGRPSSGGAPVSTGLCNKQGKKHSLPQASYAFSRHDFRLHLHGGQAVSRTNKCHQNMRAPVPTGTVSLVAVLPTPVRNNGVGR